MIIHNHKDLTDEQVREVVRECCEKIGFELIDVKNLPNSSDSYLRYVVAHKEGLEYVTWLLNLTAVGLYHGHYFTYKYSDYTQKEMREHALQDFQNRT